MSDREWRLRPWVGDGRSGGASLWLEQALASEAGGEADDVERLQPGERRRADVCIVGGGYTGLWTAIHLLESEPALDVLVLEADLCGTGASGRNGGIISDWWMELDPLVRHAGQHDGQWMAQRVASDADELAHFCARDGLEVHIERCGWMWTATTPSQVSSLRHALQVTRDAAVDVYREIDGAELPATRDLYALYDPRGGSLHPGLLARGLRRAAARRGATALEHSPVGVVRAGSRVEVLGQRGGTVSCTQVVLAANAWQAHLPDVRRDTIVVASDLIATAPVPQVFAAQGWQGSEVAFDAKAMLHYWRTTLDRRVVLGTAGKRLGFGGRVGMAFERPGPGSRRALEHALGMVHPPLAGSEITHAWSGAVDRSTSGLPRIGNLGGDRRITYVTGFSGTGVVPCVTVGRALASVVLGHDDESARFAELLRRLGPRLPPEPLRYAGGRIVQRAIAAKERAEADGRRPSPLATGIARLLPSGPTRRRP